MCAVLSEIYREIYGEEFTYESLDSRIKLQKAVYFLENLGLSVGDYSFSWDKFGPYSLALDGEAQYCGGGGAVSFSNPAKETFAKIKGYLSREHSYSEVRWVECIASLHYLKYVRGLEGDALLQELKGKKPYLDDDKTNREALSIIEEIRVGN